jgi:hypothetical protein
MTMKASPTHNPGRSESARRPAALTFWSAFGTVVIVGALVTWTRWALSPSFARNNPGPDHYPYLWYLRGFEITVTIAFFVMLWFWVVKPWRRTRHVPLDGKILLGMMFAYIVDPTLNAFNHTFAMNAYGFGFGSWADQLPIGSSPGQARFAEGLFWAPQLYVIFGLLAAMGGCAILGKLRRRLPRASNATLYAILFVLFAIADLVVEIPLIVYPQLYMFPGVPADFSLFAGRIYQFPIYQSLFAAVFAITVTWLRDSVDDTGRSAVERGVDELSSPGWRKHAMSFAAVTGFCTAAALGYFLPYEYASTTADTFVELPSYLAPAAYCGVTNKPACPSEYLYHLKNDQSGR